MTQKEIVTWEQLGEIIQTHDLAPKTLKLATELADVVRKSETAQMDDGDVGVLLLMIGEYMLRGATEKWEKLHS